MVYPIVSRITDPHCACRLQVDMNPPPNPTVPPILSRGQALGAVSVVGARTGMAAARDLEVGSVRGGPLRACFSHATQPLGRRTFGSEVA